MQAPRGRQFEHAQEHQIHERAVAEVARLFPSVDPLPCSVNIRLWILHPIHNQPILYEAPHHTLNIYPPQGFQYWRFTERRHFAAVVIVDETKAPFVRCNVGRSYIIVAKAMIPLIRHEVQSALPNIVEKGLPLTSNVR